MLFAEVVLFHFSVARDPQVFFDGLLPPTVTLPLLSQWVSSSADIDFAKLTHLTPKPDASDASFRSHDSVLRINISFVRCVFAWLCVKSVLV